LLELDLSLPQRLAVTFISLSLSLSISLSLLLFLPTRRGYIKCRRNYLTQPAVTRLLYRDEININFVAERKKKKNTGSVAGAADRRPAKSLISSVKGPPRFLADVKIFAVCRAGINLARVYPR